MWPQQQQQQQHFLQQQQHHCLGPLSMAPQQARPPGLQSLHQRQPQPMQISSDEEEPGCSYQQLQPQMQMQQQGLENVNMTEVVPHSSNPRAARNLAEKQRRDNLNSQIGRMAELVPMFSNGFSRRRDKISILRLTAAHLRQAYTIGLSAVTEEFFPRGMFPKDANVEKFMINGLAGPDCFLIVMNATGKVIYISKHIEELLGHDQADFIGDSMYNYVYKDDAEELRKGLKPNPDFLENDDGDEATSSGEDVIYRPIYGKFKDHRRQFHVRMCIKANSRREPVQYEYVQFTGKIRLAQKCQDRDPNKEYCPTSNDVIYVGTGRLLKKRTIAELSMLEANKDEYFTRHLVDGRIIFCDHRISVVAGYMTDEVSGTSAFKFMHRDDVRWTIVALRHMYDNGQNFGTSCYRLITKTGHFIYLRTHGYLEYDEETRSVGSFICINTLTAPTEGEILIAEMKKRFSATTLPAAKGLCSLSDAGFDSESDCSNNAESSLEDETNLEDAISHLISDLPSPAITDDQQRDQTNMQDPMYAKAAFYSQRLPPASFQAASIGIDPTAVTGKGKGGKGGKGSGKDIKDGKDKAMNGDKSGDKSPSSSRKNGVKPRMLAEKRIPELEGRASPSSSSVSSIPASETMFPSPLPCDPCTGSFAVEDMPSTSTNTIPASVETATAPSPYNVQTNTFTTYAEPKRRAGSSLNQPSLKRRSGTGTEEILPRKRPASVEISLEIRSQDQALPALPETNREIELPTPEQVEPMLEPTELFPGTEFISFPGIQNEQFFNPENGQEIMKLLANMQQPVNPEGLSADPVVPQYASADQVAATDNDVGQGQSQSADSLSSCSQFSGSCESTLPTPYNNYAPAHQTVQQRLVELQLNVQHDIEVYSEQ